MDVPQVEAAGGVVWRRHKGQVQFLVVHRPRYDDWSFAKGKLDPGETHKHAARREVQEETGLVCELGEKLSCVRYQDRKGRPKRVRYWLMEPIDGSFEPNDEVDEIVWLTPDLTRSILTYEHDKALVDDAIAKL